MKRNCAAENEECTPMSDAMKERGSSVNNAKKKNDKIVLCIQNCQIEDDTKEAKDTYEKKNEKMSSKKPKNPEITLFVDENQSNNATIKCTLIKSMNERSKKLLKYLLKQKHNFINDDFFKKQIFLKNVWIYFNFRCTFSLNDLILISRSFKNSEIIFDPSVEHRVEQEERTEILEEDNYKRVKTHENIKKCMNNDVGVDMDQYHEEDLYYNNYSYEENCKKKRLIYNQKKYAIKRNVVKFYFSNPFTVCFIYGNGTLHIHSTRTLKESIILLIKIVKKIKYKTFWAYCNDVVDKRVTQRTVILSTTENKNGNDNLCSTNTFSENDGDVIQRIPRESIISDNNRSESITSANNHRNDVVQNEVEVDSMYEYESLENCFLENINSDHETSSFSSEVILDEIDENELFYVGMDEEKDRQETDLKTTIYQVTTREFKEDKSLLGNKRSNAFFNDTSFFRETEKTDSSFGVDPIDNINYCEQTILQLKKQFLKYQSDSQCVHNEGKSSEKKKSAEKKTNFIENDLCTKNAEQENAKRRNKENNILCFSEMESTYLKKFKEESIEKGKRRDKETEKKKTKVKENLKKKETYKNDKYHKWKYITRKDISLDLTYFYIKQIVCVFNLNLINYDIGKICQYEELHYIATEIQNFIYIQINRQLLNLLIKKYTTEKDYSIDTPFVFDKKRDEQKSKKIVHLYYTGNVIIYACTSLQELFAIERFLVDTFKRNNNLIV